MEKTEKQNKYSIIVPTYNVEKYLDECIQSVIAQTYQNWELIIVDDESSDHSVQIARKYEQKDSRIHVYQKPHGGQAETRNTGLQHVTGDYLALLDGDDYWEKEHLSKAEQIIGDSGCDMCVGNNHINFTADWKQKVVLFPADSITSQSGLEDKLDILFSLENHLPAAACLTIYNIKFLKLNKIQYDKRYKCSEDLDFFLQCISRVEEIKVMYHEFYYYRQDNRNATTKNLTGELLLLRLKVYRKWFDYYDNKMIGKFDCKNIRKRISVDVPLNINDYFALKRIDLNKKKVKKYFYRIKYIWCGRAVKESYFWTFYIHFPVMILKDRVMIVLQYAKGKMQCHI